MSDLPRAELLKAAQAALDAHAGRATVYFKYSCSHCGARCTLDEPNVLRQRGECFNCKRVTEITAGGFLLMLPRTSLVN